ncbi:MAG: GIY-YIG nuclease family protein [Desulfurococcales archaeon]|nr:GIY-YIG nuclease family protein [Desulfurococcales archaeon]
MDRKVRASVSYVLVISILKGISANIKSLGTVTFKPGTYIYIGSANVKNPLARVLRHFKKNKKIKWHIDYLTAAPETRIMTAIVCYGLTEEAIYDIVSRLVFVSAAAKRFGSTDRRKHLTHLFKISRKYYLLHLINELSRRCEFIEVVTES